MARILTIVEKSNKEKSALPLANEAMLDALSAQDAIDAIMPERRV